MQHLADRHNHILPSNTSLHDASVPFAVSFYRPFLMRSNMSYTKIGIFTLAGYPYSFKLLWSPIVDTVYSKTIGRRKSWILPLQLISGAVMICFGSWAEERLVLGDAVGITALFFVLVLLAATQDIAVDGWALTLLSRKNVGYAATCQTVGMNIGYFASFTVFLALNDGDFCSRVLGTAPGVALVSLAGYLRFWGWVYLAFTAALAVLKAETPKRERDDAGGKGTRTSRSPRVQGVDGEPVAQHSGAVTRRRSMRLAGQQPAEISENDIVPTNGACHEAQSPGEDDIWEAYAQLWRVVRLPSVRLLAVVLVVCRLGMLPAETAAPLKLLEKGASKEALAGLVSRCFSAPRSRQAPVPCPAPECCSLSLACIDTFVQVLVEFPIELVSALIAGRWAASAHPFRPWLTGYRVRLTLAVGTTLAVAAFPTGATALWDAPWSFAALAVLGVMTSFASTLMFTALGDFYNRISDPAMGGAYLTLLNTIANTGVVVPKLGVFAAMDALTVRQCAAPQGGWLPVACGPASAAGRADGECTAAGGTCVVTRDGFYVLAGCAAFCGTWLMLWLQRTLVRLEAMPLSAWHAAPPTKSTY